MLDFINAILESIFDRKSLGWVSEQSRRPEGEEGLFFIPKLVSVMASLFTDEDFVWLSPLALLEYKLFNKPLKI